VVTNPTRHVCLLKCGHTAYYDPQPKIGDEVYCRRCRDYTKVRTSMQEYSWHCPTCHYTRPHGTDELEARRAGRRHQRKHHHVVVLRRGYDTVEILGPIGQGELSIAGERVEWVRRHQGALRALVEKRIVTKDDLSRPQ
jgi:hypothetical protein